MLRGVYPEFDRRTQHDIQEIRRDRVVILCGRASAHESLRGEMNFTSFEGATMKRLLGVLIFLAGSLLGATVLPAQERLTVLYPSPAGSWMNQ
jgi:hypothetical protein